MPHRTRSTQLLELHLREGVQQRLPVDLSGVVGVAAAASEAATEGDSALLLKLRQHFAGDAAPALAAMDASAAEARSLDAEAAARRPRGASDAAMPLWEAAVPPALEVFHAASGKNTHATATKQQALWGLQRLQGWMQQPQHVVQQPQHVVQQPQLSETSPHREQTQRSEQHHVEVLQQQFKQATQRGIHEDRHMQLSKPAFTVFDYLLLHIDPVRVSVTPTFVECLYTFFFPPASPQAVDAVALLAPSLKWAGSVAPSGAVALRHPTLPLPPLQLRTSAR
ncbi:hypothetical protein cyc_08770 [Cyclospora cayetanensis]|uniref:Uncharacterized protein n=1 Tax=Cyclospora cayetanensis TaxID=88456 RepID=A0A1D3D2L7_9EIME|nr:hypothetical protein cyc_08770 [Cyclospora cayetanensis]